MEPSDQQALAILESAVTVTLPSEPFDRTVDKHWQKHSTVSDSVASRRLRRSLSVVQRQSVSHFHTAPACLK